MSENRLTKRQGAILSAYTGILCGEFEELVRYVEEILERPIFDRELSDKRVTEEIKILSRGDFLRIVQRSENG